MWVMTLFSTAAMAFDVSLLALESVFKKANRFTLILWLTPVIYLAGMQPQNLLEIRIFGEWISYAGIGFGMVVPTLLLLLSLLRRRKKSA
ncbi:hypothetical protein HMSSN036_10930 [Paenibacillus macerans]|nr:hypothetical protein HMSSN036_10930 [Paenibacillus macerans]